MHEYGIAKQMVDVALVNAQQQEARRIRQFAIEMSRSADENEDSLRFHLQTLTRGTIAEGAQFEIQRVPTHWLCLNCGTAFEAEEQLLECPECESPRIRQAAQDEFRLASIEID